MTVNLDETEEALRERLVLRGFLVDSDAKCLA